MKFEVGDKVRYKNTGLPTGEVIRVEGDEVEINWLPALHQTYLLNEFDDLTHIEHLPGPKNKDPWEYTPVPVRKLRGA